MGEVNRRLPESAIGVNPGSPERGARRVVSSALDISVRPLTVTIDNPTPVNGVERGRELLIDVLAELRRTRRPLYRDGIFSDLDLAAAIGIDPSVLRDFKLGLATRPNMRVIWEAVKEGVGADDPRTKELEEIARQRGELKEPEGDSTENQKWLWKLGHDKIPTGDAVRLIRLSQGSSQLAFANGVPLSDSALRDIESGKRKPQESTLNDIIGYVHFDTQYPRATQLLRLQNSPMQPKTVDEFMTVDDATKIRYLRIQQGYTQKELGIKMGKKSAIAVQTAEASTDPLSERVMTQLLIALDAPEEFIEFMQRIKIGEKSAFSFYIREALGTAFYFKEFEALQVSPFSEDDAKIGAEIRQMASYGKGLQLLRKKAGVSQSGLTRDQSNVSKNELGIKAPDDYSIAQDAMDLGFSVLDDVTDALLALGIKERSGKRQRKPVEEIVLFQE